MEVFLTSIGSILSIVLLIALGYILKEKNWFSDSFSGNISKLIMNIALPASIFVSVLKYLTLKSLLSLTGALVYTFLSVIIGYIFAYILVKILNVPVGRRGTFINTVVNANTIFIGLPLNIALFGNESLPYFLVYYVTNTVSTWAFGAILIGNDTNDKDRQGAAFNWKKLFPPPLLGFIVALIFLFLSIPVPAFINSTLGYLGGIVTPLSLTGALVYTFLSVIIGYIFAYILVKILNVPVGRRGTFINTVVNANTIFIGLPLNIALFGNESLPYFLVYYVTNTVSTWAFGAILIGNDTNDKDKKGTTFNWKKLFPPPLLGFMVALIFLFLSIPVPTFVNSTLGYLGGIVTPLSLIYIGIVLHNAGLKSIKFDRDTIFALIGRFIFSPIVMLILIKFGSDILPLKDLSTMEIKTFIVQSAAPALAVLPILVNEAKGDVEYATNVVTTSTLLFVIVIPIITTLLGRI